MPPPIAPPSPCCAGLKVTRQGQHSCLSVGLGPPHLGVLSHLYLLLSSAEAGTPLPLQLRGPRGPRWGPHGTFPSLAAPQVHPMLPPQALCPAFPQRGRGAGKRGVSERLMAARAMVSQGPWWLSSRRPRLEIRHSLTTRAARVSWSGLGDRPAPGRVSWPLDKFSGPRWEGRPPPEVCIAVTLTWFLSGIVGVEAPALGVSAFPETWPL